MTGGSVAVDMYAEVVRIMTAAARRSCSDGSLCDFGDFLAGVLAATTANVGGVERLLAGRPGSWEAELVRSLVLGTLGDDPTDLLRARTEQLVVLLNVAELLEGLDLHPGLLTLGEALDLRDGRHRDSSVADEEAAAIEARYQREFAGYAERFAAAVQAAAVAIIGLSVPVLVVVDADPWSPWWARNATVNPSRDEDDPFVRELWRAAHDVLPLPNIDIRIPTTPEHLTNPVEEP